MADSFRFKLATEVIYGRGTVRQVGRLSRLLGATKVLVVTDRGVSESGTLNAVLDSLRGSELDFEVFDETERSASVVTVEKGRDLLQRKGCDVLVGVGGGSSIDCAKAIAVVATNGGLISDYCGTGKVKVPKLPVIGVPTTSGTSAELTEVAVIANPATKQQMGIRSEFVAPEIAIIDPLMTLTVPPRVTAESGMDALTHAVESYTNLAAWVPTELLALEAIEHIGRSLRAAYFRGDNIEAREGMSVGCLLAGMAFRSTRLGVCHAITGPLCGHFPISHGLANAILLPYVMEFNMNADLGKFATIAHALGENTEGLSLREAAEKSIAAVKALCRDLNIPASFARAGLEERDIEEIAAEAIKSANININARSVTEQDLVRIIQAAFHGDEWR